MYFSLEMASLLKEYRSFCKGELELHEGRELTPEDYIFRRHGADLPMTPSAFTWRFKLILKKHGLPLDLNVHSLRHTAASLMISGGADVATVSGLLGHAQVSTFNLEKCGVLRNKTGVCDSEHFSGKLEPVRVPAFLYPCL